LLEVVRKVGDANCRGLPLQRGAWHWAQPRACCVPNGSPATSQPGPGGQLCTGGCFATALAVAGLTSWADGLRNVPVKKLCCSPGGHWK